MAADAGSASDGVAIIGLAGRFPGAEDADGFFADLVAGRRGIASPVDPAPQAAAPPGASWVSAKGVLAGAEDFDAAFFGLSPRAAELIDPQHRLFLECAWQVLEQSGGAAERDGERIGVFAGASSASSYYHENLLRDPEVVASADPFQLMLSNQPSGIASLVSYRLGLTGPSLALHTACSTGLAVVAVACQHLLDYQCDRAVAGAASLSLPLRAGYWHQSGSILSPDGQCRAFDAEASGTVPGNGVGAVILKRLADAQEDGDHIYAVIRGFAMNNDGRDKVGYTAPGIDGQARVVADAQAMAGFPPETIAYIEAHGTGTPLGDAIEIEALCRAFALGSPRPGSCRIGSVKPNVGHLDAAAGIAGLIKLAYAFDRQMLPPSLGCANPNLRLHGSAFRVLDRAEPWLRGATPRRAGVSSFGMGGTNAHLVLEEAPAAPAGAACDLPVVLPLSARSADGVSRFAARIAARLANDPALEPHDVAFTMQTARTPFACRRAVVAPDRARLIEALEQADDVTEAPETVSAPVLLFPGQGAQRLGMAASFHAAYPVFRAAIDESCEIAAGLGLDLRQRLLAGQGDQAAADLRRTELAQPALFAVEVALARLLESWGLAPVMLGHSVGEFAAACIAGVFSTEDGMRLVCARGRLIQALPSGRMLAAAAPAARLEAYLSDQVGLAAVNAPDAAVLSGPDDAIADAAARLRAEGVRCTLLETSHAFHSPMMAPVLDAFAASVRQVTLRPPRPYVSGLTGGWVDAEVTDPDYWVRHLRAPVRFADAVATLLDAGHRIFLEAGPGAELTHLLLRQAPGDVLARPTLPVRGGTADHATLLAAVGAAWAAGCPVDWAALHAPGTRRRVALPPAPLANLRCWVDAPGAPAPAAAPPSTDPGDDAIEAEVIRLWRAHLGHASIAADADFYQLGGDSLLAIRMVAALRERFGIELPPHAMIEARTPAALARRIAAPRARASDPAGPFMLVTLRDGDPETPALFLPHPVGGTVHYYEPLCAALEPPCRVFGLQAQALDGVTPPGADVPAIARHAIEAMRAAQPAGPYRLVGASFGGMLAYEIAQQLADTGEGVTLLALIDTPAMEQLPRELADDAEVASYVAALLGRTLDAAALRGLARQEQIARLIAACRDVLPEGMTVADLDLHLRVFQANTDAMRRYRVTRLRQRCPVLFFKARERDAHTPAHPETSWRRVLGERLTVREIPGSHQTMMNAPFVGALAQALRPLLSRAPASGTLLELHAVAGKMDSS